MKLEKKFASGDKVEVLSSEEGFSDAWATATIVKAEKGLWLVEYSKFVDGDGKALRETVRASQISHWPLPSRRHRARLLDGSAFSARV